MKAREVSSQLYLIDLEQKIKGFDGFISSWLYKGTSTTVLVDPGPSYSIETLLEALEELGVNSLDLILLTHIHIDHAGGTGGLLHKYPEARVLCHPKGIEHLVNPEKLWQGSLKVLGEIAEAYGEILPIPENSIFYSEKVETAEGVVKAYETPGHALHHLCFDFKDWLFAGEVAGVGFELERGLYARPATPPVFKLEVFLASLDKVIDLNPRNICLGHGGPVSEPTLFLKSAREQLLLWMDITRREIVERGADPEKRIFDELLKQDMQLSGFRYLDEKVKERETYFIGNSVKGMLQYLEQ